MTLLSAGKSWFASKLHDAAASVATYARGVTTVTLASGAVPARPQTGVLDRDTGAVVDWDGHDFLILIADLGALAPPRKGDRLTIGTSVFEVQPAGDKCFEFVGGPVGAVEYRVHAKQVEE